MNEKIEVGYFKMVFGTYHKGIIYTDKSGVEYIIRGGPKEKNVKDIFIGKIEMYPGGEKNQSDDYVSTQHRELIISGDDLSEKWEELKKLRLIFIMKKGYIMYYYKIVIVLRMKY